MEVREEGLEGGGWRVRAAAGVESVCCVQGTRMVGPWPRSREGQSHEAEMGRDAVSPPLSAHRRSLF